MMYCCLLRGAGWLQATPLTYVPAGLKRRPLCRTAQTENAKSGEALLIAGRLCHVAWAVGARLQACERVGAWLDAKIVAEREKASCAR
jgi:hypothetical protein